MLRREGALLIAGVLVLVGCAAATQVAQAPGVRGGPPGAGGPPPGLTSAELAFFQAGLATFREVEAVKDGLGPRFNLDSYAGCHAQPVVNPQIAVATKDGAKNIVPSFITLNGPVREVRFNAEAGTWDTGSKPLRPRSPLSAPQVISMVKRPSLTPAVVLLAVARLAIWF